ncbi:MAG TPA: DUF3079 domain-containing protein [Oxalobacteraceae bacterium]|nr:DUF3079 domain-containing protein [Oxalobacteraceae bacterium]
MTKKIALHPKHPERICWGCDKYCPADSLRCGNGSERTPHPVELFGDDWQEWGLDAVAKPADPAERCRPPAARVRFASAWHRNREPGNRPRDA